MIPSNSKAKVTRILEPLGSEVNEQKRLTFGCCLKDGFHHVTTKVAAARFPSICVHVQDKIPLRSTPSACKCTRTSFNVASRH